MAAQQTLQSDLTAAVQAKDEKKIEEAAAGAAQLNVEIEEQRLASQKLEEEALRKDAEIRVLETNLQHQTETVERLEQEIRDADQTGATLGWRGCAKPLGITMLPERTSAANWRRSPARARHCWTPAIAIQKKLRN